MTDFTNLAAEYEQNPSERSQNLAKVSWEKHIYVHGLKLDDAEYECNVQESSQ